MNREPSEDFRYPDEPEVITVRNSDSNEHFQAQLRAILTYLICKPAQLPLRVAALLAELRVSQPSNIARHFLIRNQQALDYHRKQFRQYLDEL